MQLHVLRTAVTAPAVLAAVVVAAAMLMPGEATVLEVGGTSATAGFHEPDARAAGLGLPVPTRTPISPQGECAIALAEDVPVACFANQGDAIRYIEGTVSRHQIKLTGTGGTVLSASSGTDLGLICVSPGPFNSNCDSTASNRRHLYIPSGGGSCTHTYTANDYYRNSTGQYNEYKASSNISTTNCHFVGIYQDANQGGTGAVGICPIGDTFDYYDPNHWFNSISFSNTNTSC